MNLKKYHRAISLSLVIMIALFVIDSWLESTWDAKLLERDSWILIETNLHFYSSLILIGWIVFLAFKFLMVVEEEILDMEPYYHPISKLKSSNDNNEEIHKEIEKHENKALFYNEENNKKNAVEKMIDETSFSKDDLNRMEGKYKTDSEKALKSALSFKAEASASEELKNKAPEFLKKAPIKNNIEKISSFKNSSAKDILKEKKFKTFNLETINQYGIEFFAINSKEIFIGMKFRNQKDILVNEKEDPSNPEQNKFWFTKDSRVESPISKLNVIKGAVEKVISEVLPKTTTVNVNTVLMLENVKITNVENSKKVFAKNNIIVVGNDISEKDFPLLNNVLKFNNEEINHSFEEFIETLVEFFNKQEKLKAA